MFYFQQQEHFDKLTMEITNLKIQLKIKGDAATLDKRIKKVEEDLLGHQHVFNKAVENITLNVTFLEKSLMDAEKTFNLFQTELSKKDENIKEIEERLLGHQYILNNRVENVKSQVILLENKLMDAEKTFKHFQTELSEKDEKIKEIEKILKVLEKMRKSVYNDLYGLKADMLKQAEVNKELVSDVKYLLEGMRQVGESFEEVKKVIKDQNDINERTEKRFWKLEHAISDLNRNYRKSSGFERPNIFRDTFVFVVNKFVNYVVEGVTGLLSSLTQRLLN